MKRKKRLYREVTVDQFAKDRWAVLLDHQVAKTPAGNPLIVPTAGLAAAIAEEWRSQPAELRPEAMTLTRLANTAIDRIATGRDAAISELTGYAGMDLLCYRAAGPDALVARQAAVWDPLLDWLTSGYGVRLNTASQITPISQCTDDLDRLRTVLLQQDDFALAGIVAAANILGSLVLALALREGRITAEEAFQAGELDACYQAEIWGEDAELRSSHCIKKSEVIDITKFLRLNATV